MPDLVFLCHRIPYPPNKGDKIRAFQILKHLAGRFRVHLGCFVDDPADMSYSADLAPWAATVKCIPLDPRRSRVKAMTGLFTGSALSVQAFAHPEMRTWTDETMRRVQPAAVFLFSSAMAQYVTTENCRSVPVIMDFVDVDSDKWRQYAEAAAWPMSWLYNREARTLLAHDTRVAQSASASLLVSQAEAELFRTLVPSAAEKIWSVSNGIDCEYFSPDIDVPSPYMKESPVMVFTGTMDYRPNVDAVVWFADEILPAIRTQIPDAVFAIVGAKPAPAVASLATRPGILVTGRVDDVRPYIKHAEVVVAPLRLARGIQNKVLEGMAMGKTVVTTPQGLEGIEAVIGEHILLGTSAEQIADQVTGVLRGTSDPTLGRRARDLMVERYSWSGQLGILNSLMPGKG